LRTWAAYLQITVLVDENVGWLQVSVDDTCRVDVFQTSEDLVEEVLDELLFEWTRSEESVKIGTEELSDEVAVDQYEQARPAREQNSHVLEGRDEDIAERNDLTVSMTFNTYKGSTYVLVTEVLEKLQFSICPLAQNRGREWLHDLFDSDRSSRQLVLGGAERQWGPTKRSRAGSCSKLDQ
jgi:hypothetical protein